MAKRTRLYGVKVLDDNGSGTLANVIAGMDFVARDSKTRGCPRGAMANLSIGGSFSKAVNAAAAALVKAGVFVSASAGGSNGDAGKTSPASEPAVCTVAASTERDARAPFSDYGSVIDIFAPGTNIKSAWLGGTTVCLLRTRSLSCGWLTSSSKRCRARPWRRLTLRDSQPMSRHWKDFRARKSCASASKRSRPRMS